MSVTAWFDGIWASTTRERCLTGAKLFRLAAGAAILLEYLVNYAQRKYLFGPNGVFPYAAFLKQNGAFSIYRWSSSGIYFELCFHLGVVVALLWFLGYGTRLLTPLNYIFWTSLHQRNSPLWDGGDNVMQVVFVYAIFANLTGRSFNDPRGSRRSHWREVAGLLHNAAIVAIAAQIALVYGVAGLTKVQGVSWQNGTALYYALRSAEFRLPGVSERLYSSDVFLTFLAYSTVAFQISFSFLLLMGRKARALAVGIAMSFHLGIMFAMGLVTFALFMLACDLAIVADEEYVLLGQARLWCAGIILAFFRRILPFRSSRAVPALSAAGPPELPL